MNHSKYDPKLDPKNISKQASVTPASVPAPAAVDAAVVLEEKTRQDAKANYQGSPVALKAVTGDKGSDAMVSEGGHIATGNTTLRAAHEPSALMGGVATLPAAPADADKAPALSARPVV